MVSFGCLFKCRGRMASSEYRCCCNSHVHNAVIATAIISLLGGGVAIVFVIASFLWMFLPLPVLASFGNLSLLLGRCTKTACLYWIYFITQVLYIAGVGLWCLYLFIWGNAIVEGEYDKYYDNPHVKKGFGTYLTVLGCLGVVYFFFNIYFFHIAVKSYKYLTRVLSIQEVHVDTVVEAPPAQIHSTNPQPTAPTFSPEASPRQPLDYQVQPPQAQNYPPSEAPPAYEQQHMYPMLPKSEFRY
ncbi:unnamed protein product [Bursaphelenchus xylophilus]|uniref:(pine wood nematode) hypothetical protein n=1 Tax=Bursaphelenchus xylophilus TaxID=6326 RepID=A0A1I7SUQ6_BURXY|nr:unnamed protein product [Bursaphelenchus xylophilus]CAG9125950.1 unnamed protein product [Bursaphelenchus xylophilus]